MATEIKLIVTDLDGTLLDSHHNLPNDFWQVEQQLQEQNILLAIASGRQFYNILNVFDRIKDRTIFLAENGTYAYYQGQELFVNPLDKKAAIEFIKIGRNVPNSFIIVCGKESAYVESNDEQFLSEAQKYYARLQIVADLTQVNDTILKVTLCDFTDVPTNSYLYFKEFEQQFRVAISGPIWLDITSFSANKGVAVAAIQKQLGITFDQTMVFGDFLNDYEMMQKAKYSYAMKNAHPEIIKIANFLTRLDNNKGGVTQTIHQEILTKI